MTTPNNKKSSHQNELEILLQQQAAKIAELEKAQVVEAALDKVRTRTMAMKHPDELREVVAVLQEQITALQIADWGSNILIADEAALVLEHWVASFDQAQYPESYSIRGKEHPVLEEYWMHYQAQTPLFTITLAGEKRASYNKYVFTHTDLKRFPEEVKAHISTLGETYFCYARMKYGHLAALGGTPLLAEHFAILQRFAKVFEQTYTRFLDLQKAEAQAKEAQIEAALERVRSRTMAMHKSEDLKAVVKVMYQEMVPFGFDAFSCTIHLFHKETQNTEVWMEDLSGAKHLQSYFWYGREHPLINELWDAWEQKETQIVVHLKDEEKKSADDYLLEKTDYRQFPEAVKNQIRSEQEVYHTPTFFKDGFLSMTNFKAPSPSQKDILQRFAKVFEQTYTRFLDLQKAEAQAREAQIEAALERVRARAMAMHKSEELSEVAITFFQQYKKINQDTIHNWISLVDPNANTLEIWTTDGITATAAIAKGEEQEAFQNVINAWKKQENLQFSLEKKFAKKVLKNKFGLTLKPPKGKSHFHLLESRHRFGFIGLGTWEKANEENLSILQRFAKVFEQTYTRFLDLQKAEGQAREAQIEASLERVRSRTMAMHKSEELSEVVKVLYQEIKPFGFATFSCTIHLLDKKTQNTEVWMEDITGAKHLQNYYWYGRENPIINEMWEAWEQQLPIWAIHLKAEEKRNFDNYLFEKTDYKQFPEEVKNQIRSANEAHFTMAYFKDGYITVTGFIAPSLLQREIIQRFAKVFDQTYTRFLDLQKAEAQAREAQIEAALERVRSASMAMQTSGELGTILGRMLEEMTLLDMNLTRAIIWTFHPEERTTTWWGGHPEIKNIAKSYNISYDISEHHSYFKTFIKAWKAQEKSFVYKLGGAEKVSWDEILFLKSELKNLPTEVIQGMREPETVYASNSFNEFGVLMIGSLEPLSETNLEIIKRFSNLFEQTYRRFLDVQEAEERAREAQIEAALERVRARAMAMRHSEELSEAAELLYQEFFKLGVEPFSCGYLINDAEKEEWKIWLTNPGEPFFKEYWTIPYTADHNLQMRYQSWQKQEAFHCAVLEGAANQAHHQVICKYAPWKEEVTGDLAPQLAFNSAHFSLGHLLVISLDRLSAELEQAMVRFANVFDLTYRRFLDLEKAEAQNRQLEKTFEENQRLLHSILPQQIAEKIQAGEQTIVKRFEQVSILFADIVGFTILSEKISPQEVVDILNGLFSKFDDLTDKYGLEKIKTIGDAYMVASGVPEEKENHALVLFQFAQDMLQAIQDFNQVVGTNLKIRIGISSGPVVAGVIGKKKFAYDLWGDSVNTAARMEANGQADCIQISPTTYAILKADFVFEKIPNVAIKGKGMMDVYLWTALGI